MKGNDKLKNFNLNGWKPDPKDDRDYLFQGIAEAPAKLPKFVDLEPMCSEVDYQGHLGSCTGMTLGPGLMELELIKNGRPTSMSALFIYFMERQLDNIEGDTGAYLRTGMKVLKNIGCSPEKYWPYIEDNWDDTPTLFAKWEARKYKISSYYRLFSLGHIKTCLAANFGVALGFWVYESFGNIGSDGIMPLPAPDEAKLGGHAVFCVGYDDSAKLLKIKNSWSSEWGDHGYFYMPYEFVKPNKVVDMWVGVMKK